MSSTPPGAPDGTPSDKMPPGAGTAGTSGKAPTPTTPPVVGAETGSGALPVTRLSRLEYRNTLRDLLGEDVVAPKDLPADALASSGFEAGGGVSPVDARLLMTTAESVGARIASKLPGLAACKTGQAEADCAAAFVKSFGRRAFRRALDATETTRLTGLYEKARKDLGYDFGNALRVVVQYVIQSPALIYHWELGPRDPKLDPDRKAVRLTADETAARLSYFLWRSMPDDALFAEVDRNALTTPEQIEAQARRLLADRRATDAVADFHEQWLKMGDLDIVEKDATLFPSFSAADAVSEVRAFTGRIVLGDGGGSFDALMTAPFTYAPGALAKIYGAQSGGDESQKLTLDAGQRAGVLTQVGFLSRHATTSTSHPIKRGAAIAKRVLCAALGDPPPNVPEPKPPAPGLTTRERFAEHGANACAVGCHSIIDPLGFAFETYDAVGAWRTKEGTKTIDASAEVTIDGAKVKVAGAVELARALAKSDAAKACYGEQLFRYGIGRANEAADAPALAAARSAFTSKGDVRDLMVAIAKSRSFVTRTVAEGEVTP